MIEMVVRREVFVHDIQRRNGIKRRERRGGGWEWGRRMRVAIRKPLERCLARKTWSVLGLASSLRLIGWLVLVTAVRTRADM